MKSYWVVCLIFIVATALSTNVAADYNSNMGNTGIGKPGKLANVNRVIRITVIENMFLPAEIIVRQGETIRLIVKNGGNKKHEIIIDTMQNLKKQAKMRRVGSMPIASNSNQLQLKPGERKELIWEFTRQGAIGYACPLPGHFKKMRGKIIITL